MPPDVDPEQPPIAKIIINIIEANEFQDEKSSRPKQVDDITEITLKKPTRNALSTS